MAEEKTTEELKLAIKNKRQRDFAVEYLESGNAYQSAIKAGYSDNYAKAQSSKLLENVGIKSYIDAVLREKEEKKIMSALEAMKKLSHIARGDIKVMTVVSNAEGYSEVEVPPDFAQQINAIKEILKRTPHMTSYDRLKLTEMQQKQAEKEIDIAIKKRKLEILNGTSEDTMDAVSDLISKIDGTFKK